VADEDLSPRVSAAVRALGQARGACPSAEALVEYEALDPDDRARHAIDPHVQICSRCQLVLLHLAEPRAEIRLALWRSSWVLPAAAVLLLGVMTPLLYRTFAPAAPVDTVRGTELQPIAPAGPVAAVREFQWQSPIQAAQYRVRVYRGTDVIWMSTTETASVTVDPSLIFDRGVEYAWQVEALDLSGDARLTSPRQTFVVR
jgi:hypothetical protein